MSVLPGGLRVCVDAVPQYGRGLAAVALTVAAGGDDDPAGRHGTAHLVEHLMFPRSGPGDAGDLAGQGHAALIEGAGGVCNAETHRDHTVFHTTVPAELLPDVLTWEARRLLGFAPTEDVIRTETAVIGEEIRGAGAAGRYWESALGALYPGSRDSFGTAAELAGITAGEAERFFRAHYTAPRMVLSVVGDVDPARVTAAVHEVFDGVGVPGALGVQGAQGVLEAPGTPEVPDVSGALGAQRVAGVSGALEETRASGPVPASRQEIRTASLSAAGPGVAVGHRLPDLVTDRPAYLAQAVLAQVLGRSRLPALARSARDGHRLTSATVTCGYHGQWLASAAPDLTLAVLGRAAGTGVDAAMDVWRSVLRSVADRPLSETEHRRAVNSLLVAWHRQADSLPTRAVALGRDALLLPGSAGPDALPAELRRTTPAEVSAAARALLEGPTTVTELVPQEGIAG
ncbi:insulinase family protein [Streptomyces sp. C11-1]|uniref:Insulinase family protein n=1 Tax=Streptomyces durocortorensis TaxID=2811104 RepID=A0ABY9VVV7_9ACTN|nr:insulinase family protein [Streptomyces durocortorensis]WNF27933.1 insulinase family protein [Streptomyces durocortorensis]